jgi:hypothetical protein
VKIVIVSLKRLQGYYQCITDKSVSDISMMNYLRTLMTKIIVGELNRRRYKANYFLLVSIGGSQAKQHAS